MVRETSTDAPRVNARKTDVFDVFNFKHYMGPNLYLDTAALVFDFALTVYNRPLPIDDYVSVIGDRYPNLHSAAGESYAHLFAQTVSEVGKLDMDLHLNRWSVKLYQDFARISVQSLHERTTRAVAFFIWDWFEALKTKTSCLRSRLRRSRTCSDNRFTVVLQSMLCCKQLLAKVFPPFICGMKDLCSMAMGRNRSVV